MKRLILLATLLLPMSVLAQRSGDVKDIDGQKFTYDGSTWVHNALSSSERPSKAYSVVYRDKTWQKWYAEGSPTLKKILDLGSKVRFKYKGPDGQYHTYGVFESKAALKAAVGAAGAMAAAGGGAAGAAAAGGGAAGAAAGMAITTKVLIGAGAIVAGAVVVDQVDDDDSPNRR